MRSAFLVLFLIVTFAAIDAQCDLWTVHTPDNDVMCVAREGDYFLWCGGTFGATRLLYSGYGYGQEKVVYTSGEGLAGHPVTDIALAEDGKVWFATWGSGLSCLDGENWTTYNTSNCAISSNHLLTAVIDGEGRIWTSSEWNPAPSAQDPGVNVLDGGSWTTYRTDNSGLPSSQVWDIAVDKEGNMWFATSYGATVFDGTDWQTYNADNSGMAGSRVNTISVDSLGNRWFGTDEGLSVFDGATWQAYTPDNSGLPAGVNCISFDPDGRVWIGTYGVCVFDGTTWTGYTSGDSGLIDNNVRSIQFDIDGRAWIATWGGLNVFDGSLWTERKPGKSGPTGGSSSPAVHDDFGRTWCGSYHKGVSVFDGDNWRHYDSTNSGLPYDSPLSVAIDPDGVAWISTFGYGAQDHPFDPPPMVGGGVVAYDGFTWKRYTPTDGLAADCVADIAVDHEGKKWCAVTDAAHLRAYATRSGGRAEDGSSGVSVFDGEEWTTLNSSNSGLASDYVSDIEVDGLNRKWFAHGSAGISVLDTEGWKTYTTSNSGLPADKVWELSFDNQNRLWFRGDVDGIGVFDGDTWAVYNTENSGIVCDRVYSATADQNGKMWFGTFWSGACSFDGTNWTAYNTANSGLADDDYITDICVDQYNRKWFSGCTYGGVSILTEGAPPGGTPPPAPSDPYPPDGATASETPVTLTWECQDADPGDRLTYDIVMLTGGGMGMETTTIASGLTNNEYQYFPLDGGSVWYVVATDEQGNQTTGPEWVFHTDSSSYFLSIGNVTMGPGAPAVGEATTLSFTLTNDGAAISEASCHIEIQAKDQWGQYPSSYDVIWWTDGDMLLSLNDFDNGETVEVERSIVIMAPAEAVDELIITIHLLDSSGRMLRCQSFSSSLTLASNANEYIDDMVALLGAMSRPFDVESGYDYSFRIGYLYPHRVLTSGVGTYAAAAMYQALLRGDLEAVGKYQAQLLASYADAVCADGSGLTCSDLLRWAITSVRSELTDLGPSVVPASDIRDLVCSLVRHYNLFTAPKLERSGMGFTNNVLAFFYSSEATSLPTCFAFDGSSGEIANMKPERTGTYSLDLLQVASTGVETLSRFTNIPLQGASIVAIKALSSDLNEPVVCLDADGNGIFDQTFERFTMQTTPAYPIQSFGWNKTEAQSTGRVKATFTLVNPGPAQDIDIYIACDLGDGQLLFYPSFTPDGGGIPFMAPAHFYLERFSAIDVAVPYGLEIAPIHFYCGISSPDGFELLRPIDFL